MTNLSENLIFLRKQKNKNQTYIANLINKTQAAYAKYERGLTEPDTQSLKILANFYKISVDDLIFNNPSNILNGQQNKQKGFKIPVLGTIPAGIPIEAVEEVLDYEEIPEEWTTQGEYFGLKVKGNSMEPRIMNGDVVICRKQNNAESGDVCVIMVNGNDATLKQIKKDTNGISLVPFNQNYSPMFYNNEQIATLPVRIIGKVVELRGKF